MYDVVHKLKTLCVRLRVERLEGRISPFKYAMICHSILRKFNMPRISNRPRDHIVQLNGSCAKHCNAFKGTLTHEGASGGIRRPIWGILPQNSCSYKIVQPTSATFSHVVCVCSLIFVPGCLCTHGMGCRCLCVCSCVCLSCLQIYCPCFTL